MKLKVLMATFLLAMSPAIAFASCSGHGEETASSCMDGFVWDGQAGRCVERITG